MLPQWGVKRFYRPGSAWRFLLMIDGTLDSLTIAAEGTTLSSDEGFTLDVASKNAAGKTRTA